MKIYKFLLMLLTWFFLINHSFATETLKLHKVTDDVYALVGELGNRTAENFGNNATFGVVITSDGVVLIDSGGTYKGAKEIHRLIREITEKPIITVINTGGQDHRWLGNEYFKEQGATVIASQAAVNDQKARFQDQFIMLSNLAGEEAVRGTNAIYADKTFKEHFEFKLGDTIFKIRHSGQAHTPGDSFVWLPQKKVMFTGDIVYIKRMLGIGTQSNSKSWINVYQTMAAYKPKFVIPGHGQPTDLATAKSDTYDYLVFLRKNVSDFIDAGGTLVNIGSINQSKFNYLLNHESLAGRNAHRVFTEIEWE